MNNDIILNRFITPIEEISDIFELNDLVNELKRLNELDKMDRILNQKRIEEIHLRLSKGIAINKSSDIESMQKDIISFITKFGYSEELFMSMFKNTYFAITDLKMAFDSKGVAQSSENRVYYDSSILSFDEKGQFTGFLSEDKDFIRHVTIHELFHRISAYRDDNANIIASDSALSEGFTEYFAQLVSGYNGEKKSKAYQFSKDICIMFSSVLGINNVLSDYIDNLETYPNLQNLFLKYEVNFKEFVHLLDNSLSRRFKKDNEEEIIEDEKYILTILKDSILTPYINDNPQRKEEIEMQFNLLFSKYNISFQIENNISM